MKRAILFASAAMLALTGPADAKSGHPKHVNKGDVVRGVEDHPHRIGYGVGGCPPGLAKKNPECMPPGRYKKQFEVGQRVPLRHGGLLGYNALPPVLHARYGSSLDPNSRYLYDNNYLYRVDPKTLIVSDILRVVLR